MAFGGQTATAMLDVCALKTIRFPRVWERKWSGENSRGNFLDKVLLPARIQTEMMRLGGLEDRTNLWLGVTLILPKSAIPIMTIPEETYLVISGGEFK
jgi:hypothetical protein